MCFTQDNPSEFAFGEPTSLCTREAFVYLAPLAKGQDSPRWGEALLYSPKPSLPGEKVPRRGG